MKKTTTQLVSSRLRSTWVNIAGNQGMVLLNIIRNLFLIPLYLKYIPVEIFGVWLAFSGPINIIGMADLGINALLTQRVASIYGSKKYRDLGRTIVSSLTVMGAFSIFAYLIFWSFCPVITEWLGIKSDFYTEVVLALRLAGLEAVLMLLVLGMGSILIGLQQPTAYMLGMISAQVTGIAVTLITLWAGWGVMAIPIGMLTGTALVLAGTSMSLWKAVNILSFLDLRFDLVILNELLKSSALLLIVRICRLFITRSYGMVVAAVLSAQFVVIFEVTRKASIVVIDIVSRIPMSLLPGITHLLSSGEYDKFRNIVILLLRTTFYFAIIILVAVFMLNQEFVRLWIEDGFYGGNLLNCLFCIYALMSIMNSVVYNVIFAANKIGVITFASLCEAILQLNLSIALGYLWGLKGVALASVFAIVFSLIILVYMLVKIMGAKFVFQDIITPKLFYIFLGIICVIIFWYLQGIWFPRGWLQMGAFVVLYMCLGSSLILFLDRNIWKMLASIINLR